MKKNNVILMLACAAGVFLSACTGKGTNREVNYNDYTGTDTEAFNFLKKGYYEAKFQVFATKHVSDAALAKELTDFYAQVAVDIEKIATAEHVLVPNLGENPFTSTSVETPASSDSSAMTVTDSIGATDKPSKDYFEKSMAERILLSQEEMLHQTENASSNTNVRIRAYAKDILPKIESLLEKSKVALK